MRHLELAIAAAALFTLATGAIAQSGGPAMATEHGPYARLSFLRPNSGDTIDFEAGYTRHLEWHRQAGDSWTWFGWTVWAGERQRWLAYATFGHSAAALDASVSPAEDERDNVANVVRHCEFAGSSLYEYLPELSQGTGEPTAAARVEFATVDVTEGSAEAFEAAIGAQRTRLQGETLWYRLVAGGPTPRYLRLRPRPSLAALLAQGSETALPPEVSRLIAKTTLEILNLRPTLSYRLPATHP